MEPDAPIFVAGHRGLVGQAMIRRLEAEGFVNVITKGHDEFDLRNQEAVNRLFSAVRIQYVFLCAGKVGGIYANVMQQADFLYDNLMIAANVIHAAARYGVKKLLFLGSSCIYPREAPQPLREESLLTGALERTNQGYALAKIVGVKLCEWYHRQYGHRFISAMPTNLYGIADNFHRNCSHVIPGMMRRFHEAKLSDAAEVTLWGTGSALREFLNVDDLSNALLLLMRSYGSPEMINIGSGEELSIAQLAQLVKEVVGFKGRITFDSSMPDGTPRKTLDSSRILAMGWRPSIPLTKGLQETYAWAQRSGLLNENSSGERVSAD